MKKRYDGKDGYRLKLEIIRDAVEQHGTVYEGKVVMLPGAKELAQRIGRTSAFFYMGPESAYEEKIHEATGLSLIHKGGIVVAASIANEEI